MSLLSVCQDVADVIGITRPTAIITGSYQQDRQFLGLARETLDELCNMDWPVLEIPYAFNTVVSQAQYDLPVDFKREAGDTVYAGPQYHQLRGSLTAADWKRQRDATQAHLGRYRFRIYGLPLKINLGPIPQVIEEIIMEYQTTYKVRQTDGSYKDTFYADTDISLVPEDLLKKGIKWRMRHVKGLDYSEEFDDYEKDRTSRLAQQLQLGSMPIAYRNAWDAAEGLGVYVPDSGYGP